MCHKTSESEIHLPPTFCPVVDNLDKNAGLQALDLVNGICLSQSPTKWQLIRNLHRAVLSVGLLTMVR